MSLIQHPQEAVDFLDLLGGGYGIDEGLPESISPATRGLRWLVRSLVEERGGRILSRWRAELLYPQTPTIDEQPTANPTAQEAAQWNYYALQEQAILGALTGSIDHPGLASLFGAIHRLGRDLSDRERGLSGISARTQETPSGLVRYIHLEGVPIDLMPLVEAIANDSPAIYVSIAAPRGQSVDERPVWYGGQKFTRDEALNIETQPPNPTAPTDLEVNILGTLDRLAETEIDYENMEIAEIGWVFPGIEIGYWYPQTADIFELEDEGLPTPLDDDDLAY